MNREIHTELKELAPGFPQGIPEASLGVPQDYFRDFSERLMSRIQAETLENETISPILQELKGEQPFHVPSGYFEGFQPRIHSGKVVLLPTYTRLKMVLKYAAAACLIGIIITFVTLNSNQKATGEAESASLQTGQEISEGAFVEYFEDWDQNEAEEDEESVEKSTNLLVDINTLTINELLSEMGENEIKYYMQYAGIDEQPALTL